HVDRPGPAGRRERREPRRADRQLPTDRRGDRPSGQRRSRERLRRRSQAGGEHPARGRRGRHCRRLDRGLERREDLRLQSCRRARRRRRRRGALVARAEGYGKGLESLDDTLKRLQAFEKAGADVLYAPHFRDIATMKIAVSAVSKPLNVVMSAADPSITVAEMEAIGVKRVSVGGALARLAMTAFMKGAREMKEKGGFTWVRDAMSGKDLKAVLR